MKQSELRQKSREEVRRLLAEKRLDLSRLYREISLGKEKNTSLVRKQRRGIAQCQTVLGELDILVNHE